MEQGKKAGYIGWGIFLAILLWFVYYLWGVPAAEVWRAERIVRDHGEVLLRIADRMEEIGAPDIYRKGISPGYQNAETAERFPQLSYGCIFYSVFAKEADTAEQAEKLLPAMEGLYWLDGIFQAHLMKGYLEFAMDVPPGPVPRVIYFPKTLLYSETLSEKELEAERGSEISKDLGGGWYLEDYPE